MAKETWMWLVAGLGFGAVNTGELLEAYPQGAEAILNDLGSGSLDEILTQKQAEKLASTRPADYALSLAHAETQGIYALPYDDHMYPEMLRSITNPPLLLFVKGDLSLLNGQLSIGMVGARRPSGYGVEAVKTIGRGVALGGAIIVSGLAAGLDSEAHKAALTVNGPTIACIAFGHDHCYPAQNKKLMEVIERYGAVISEYPLGTKPEKPYFLHRNRLIAGLSHALVVTEARKHSGTMSTVNFATDYGRDVFAVPGSIFSELSGGTNAMIRDGAYLAASATDVLSMYGIELSEEDIAKTVETQAREGRPAMASAGPPWQQNLANRPSYRQMEHQDVVADDISPPDVAAGEQTMLEALQTELKQSGKAYEGGDRVSRGAAIDAFRRLQQEIPPTANSEVDARNRALDEMVAAVSDDIDISRPPQKQAKDRSQRRREMQKLLAEQEGEKVKPFQWGSLERLTKEDVAKNEQEQARKRSRRKPAKEVPLPIPMGGGVGPIPPVSAVEPIGSNDGITAIAPLDRTPKTAPPAATDERAPKQGATPAKAEKPAAPKTTSSVGTDASAPLAPRKKSTEKKAAAKQEGRSPMEFFRREDDTLSEKLKTMNKSQQAEPPASSPWTPKKQEDAGVYQPTRGVTGATKQIKAPAGTPLPLPQEVPPPTFTEIPPAESIEVPSVAASAALAETPPPPEPPAEPVLSSQFTFPASDRVEDDLLATVSENAKRAYDHLGVNPVTLAQISENSDLTPGEAMAALTELELAGLSRQLPGRRFVIMQ